MVFVSNHSSWLDIPVLGGRLEACFVAKDEVGTLAGGPHHRPAGPHRVTSAAGAARRPRSATRCASRLAGGDNLILFPEGTTSDGSRVLPFRSAFFAIAEAPTPDAPPPLIQPVSVVYDRLGGLPTGRATRPLFAWYGDMDMASHFWRLAQHRGLRATVLLHAPLDPAQFPDRKALAQAAWKAVADGAAALRQNRPAKPLAPEPVLDEDDGSEPAFA